MSEIFIMVKKLRREGVEIAAIHERLKERGYAGSYLSVHRWRLRRPMRTVKREQDPELVEMDALLDAANQFHQELASDSE